MRHLVICVRRWFDRTSGHTYHSVAIYEHGKDPIVIPITRGYDRAYEGTAATVLGYKDQRNPHWVWFRDNFDVIWDVVDVYRRKDLHSNGQRT